MAKLKISPGVIEDGNLRILPVKVGGRVLPEVTFETPGTLPNLEGGFVARVYDDYILRAGNEIISSSYNTGREMGAESLRVQGAMISAILDKRTCPLCYSLDGLEFKIPGEFFSQTGKPPYHAACRCVLVYVMADESGWKPDNVEEYTNKRTEQWLKSVDFKTAEAFRVAGDKGIQDTLKRIGYLTRVAKTANPHVEEERIARYFVQDVKEATQFFIWQNKTAEALKKEIGESATDAVRKEGDKLIKEGVKFNSYIEFNRYIRKRLNLE